MGSVTDASIFSHPNWDVKCYVPFDGVEGPSCLVSQIVHSFVEVACGADIYADVGIMWSRATVYRWNLYWWFWPPLFFCLRSHV
jgi:hypothetical protein